MTWKSRSDWSQHRPQSLPLWQLNVSEACYSEAVWAILAASSTPILHHLSSVLQVLFHPPRGMSHSWNCSRFDFYFGYWHALLSSRITELAFWFLSFSKSQFLDWSLLHSHQRWWLSKPYICSWNPRISLRGSVRASYGSSFSRLCIHPDWKFVHNDHIYYHHPGTIWIHRRQIWHFEPKI